MFPDLAEWLESPWTGPPPFLAGQMFRLEESIRDDRYVIRAELPGLDPETDIEVTVDGRILTIRAERRQQDNGPYRVGVPLRIAGPRGQAPPGSIAADVTARYDKGVLEISVPVRVIKPEGTRIPDRERRRGARAAPDQAVMPDRP